MEREWEEERLRRKPKRRRLTSGSSLEEVWTMDTEAETWTELDYEEYEAREERLRSGE